MSGLDSSTRRVLREMSEYLDDIQGRAHLPVSQEVVESLQSAVEGIRSSTAPEPLSPGQQEAAEASTSVLERVQISEDELSPGEREVAELGNAS